MADDEINTAILLSDGDSFLTRNLQRKTIKAWTGNNSGMGGMIIVRSSASSPFSHTQALGSNEMLLVNGLYESFNNTYYIDYSNHNTGLTNATTNLTGHTGVNIGGTNYLFATFTLTPSIELNNTFELTPRSNKYLCKKIEPLVAPSFILPEIIWRIFKFKL